MCLNEFCGTKYRIRSKMSFDNLSLQDVMGLAEAFGPMKNEKEWYIQKRWFCFWFTVNEHWFQYIVPKTFKSKEEAEQYMVNN